MTTAAPPQDTAHDLEVGERYERLLVELLLAAFGTPDQPLTVLDFACGTGLTALALAERLPKGSRVVALSEDRRRLNALHRRLTPPLRHTIYPRRQNRQRLPFAAGAFDLVYATLGLEQLSPPQPYLTQALRVLRPDGRILLALPLRESCFELVGTFGALLEKHVPEATWRPLVTAHGPLEELEAWIGILERSSVSEIEVERRRLTLTLHAPLSRDPLFANVLLPMWVGDEPGAQLELLELLDRYVQGPIEVVHHLGLVSGRATRTAPEVTIVR